MGVRILDVCLNHVIGPEAGMPGLGPHRGGDVMPALAGLGGDGPSGSPAGVEDDDAAHAPASRCSRDRYPPRSAVVGRPYRTLDDTSLTCVRPPRTLTTMSISLIKFTELIDVMHYFEEIA
jgi:hypothetical protein